MEGQEFCLRWNNFPSSILSALSSLREDERFVDVTLSCEGHSIRAHRNVLSACSPYFCTLLKDTPCRHPIIILRDVQFSDLAALIQYIYTGEANVSQESLHAFLKTAEMLQVRGLSEQLTEGNEGKKSKVLPDENSEGPNSRIRTQSHSPLITKRRRHNSSGSDQFTTHSNSAKVNHHLPAQPLSPVNTRTSQLPQSPVSTRITQIPASQNASSGICQPDEIQVSPDPARTSTPSLPEVVNLKEEPVDYDSQSQRRSVDFQDHDVSADMSFVYGNGTSSQLADSAGMPAGNRSLQSEMDRGICEQAAHPLPLLSPIQGQPVIGGPGTSAVSDHTDIIQSQEPVQAVQSPGDSPDGPSNHCSAHPVVTGVSAATRGPGVYVPCPHCHKLITSVNLPRHIRMAHTNMEACQCFVCKRLFKNKYSLQTHMKAAHKKPLSLRYQ